jgi:hypothetical protein
MAGTIFYGDIDQAFSDIIRFVFELKNFFH